MNLVSLIQKSHTQISSFYIILWNHLIGCTNITKLNKTCIAQRNIESVRFATPHLSRIKLTIKATSGVYHKPALMMLYSIKIYWKLYEMIPCVPPQFHSDILLLVVLLFGGVLLCHCRSRTVTNTYRCLIFFRGRHDSRSRRGFDSPFSCSLRRHIISAIINCSRNGKVASRPSRTPVGKWT